MTDTIYITKLAAKVNESYPELTAFEALNLAIQLERNEILRRGLNVDYTDKIPPSLEAIAIAMGYKE